MIKSDQTCLGIAIAKQMTCIAEFLLGYEHLNAANCSFYFRAINTPIIDAATECRYPYWTQSVQCGSFETGRFIGNPFFRGKSCASM